MSNKIAMARSVSKVGLWTLGSRILGLIRDSVIARLFGVGFATDAFMVAFTIPNLLRRLLAEGALSIAFVPLFSDLYRRRTKEEFHRTFQIVFTVFNVILIGVTIAGIVFSPWIVKIFAPGFDAEKFQLTCQLNRWMFPFIFFMGSSSVVIGILNALHSFSVPAAAPILLNLCMITCAFLLHSFFDFPIYALVVGVLLGGFAQWILQIWKVGSFGFKIGFKWDLRNSALQRIFVLMGPSVFGVAVYHLNVMVSRALASLLPQGSVTYLYYSDRFLEFPLGIFAISIATVALPQLAYDATHSDYSRFKDTLFFSLRLAMFICLPAMFGLMALRVPILSIVFQYGKFTFQNTVELAQVFLMAVTGLCAVAGLRITVQAFYSLGDVRQPVKIAFISFLCNAGFGYVLMRWLGTPGLTLGSSLSAWIQWIALLYCLRKKIGRLGLKSFFWDILPIFAASLIMFVVVGFFGIHCSHFLQSAFYLRVLWVFGVIVLGIGVYMGAAFIFGARELRFLLNKFLRKIKRTDPVGGGSEDSL